MQLLSVADTCEKVTTQRFLARRALGRRAVIKSALIIHAPWTTKSPVDVIEYSASRSLSSIIPSPPSVISELFHQESRAPMRLAMGHFSLTSQTIAVFEQINEPRTPDRGGRENSLSRSSSPTSVLWSLACARMTDREADHSIRALLSNFISYDLSSRCAARPKSAPK